MIRISVPARVHLTLIGMDRGGYRINGGLGFAITGYDLEVEVRSAADFALLDHRDAPLSKNEIENIGRRVGRLLDSRNHPGSVIVELYGRQRCHHGLGSGTATLLGILEAVGRLVEDDGIGRDELVELSGRGGTSGVGVRTYFDGGFAVDIGRRADAADLHEPSDSFTTTPRPALGLLQCAMPAWRFAIALPNEPVGMDVELEKDLFRRICPLPAASTHATLYHAVYGIAASVLEVDWETFTEALAAVQKCEWKAAEWAAQDEDTVAFASGIREEAVETVALSSMGPALLLCGDARELDTLRSRGVAAGWTVEQVFPNNVGRVLEIDA